MPDQLPEEIAELRAIAHDHKVKRDYHRRQTIKAIRQLQRRCRQLGVPVPPISLSTSTQTPKEGPQ